MTRQGFQTGYFFSSEADKVDGKGAEEEWSPYWNIVHAQLMIYYFYFRQF